MKLINKSLVAKKMPVRLAINSICKGLFFLATLFGLLVLAILFYRIFTQGIGHLNGDFLQNFASRKPEEAGIKAALIGSLWLMAVVAPVALMLGCWDGHLFRGICEEELDHHFYQSEYFQSGRSSRQLYLDCWV